MSYQQSSTALLDKPAGAASPAIGEAVAELERRIVDLGEQLETMLLVARASTSELTRELGALHAKLNAIEQTELEGAVEAVVAGEETSDSASSRKDPCDVDAARLIVLNLALKGVSKKEAKRYLYEHADAGLDVDLLVDEIFEKVGK